MESNTEELQAVQAADISAAAEPIPVVAVVGVVREIAPIDGADRIQLAVVDTGEQGTWSGVVTKDIYAGHGVLVLLQDALLPPDNERWAFMSKHKWRVRMARFKGVPSECVILPLDEAEEQIWSVGQDVGGQLGITKYSKPIPAEMAGRAKGNFPSFIVKTDEPNFQRVRAVERDAIMGGFWEARLKYDGTSCTAFVTGDPADPMVHLHVCSRNLELEDDGNLYWQMAKKYQLWRLPVGIALQFEIIGPGVQGNPLDLAEHEIRVFTVFGVDAQCKAPVWVVDDICESLHLPRAQLVANGRGNMSDNELRAMAEAARYPNGKPAEGVVIRDLLSTGSMKVISLAYKD